MAKSARSSQRLGALLAIVFVFNSSLIYSGWQRRQQDAAAGYDNSVAAIQQKIDSAEASLIYRDEERARQLLDEATALTAALPEKTAAQKQLKTVLNDKIAAKAGALRRAVKLAAPDVVAAISATSKVPDLVRLAAAGDILWSAASDGSIYKISLKDGSAAPAGSGPDGQSPTILIADGGGVIAGASDGRLTVVSGRSSTAKSVDLTGLEARIADADLYGGRLYLLDPTHNRILRADPTSAGYAKPKFYLKDGTDVSQAVSLSIDGSVYVLLKNGVAARLVKGARDNFSLGSVDPALGAPARIRAPADSGYVYVLDKAPARIVSFDKKTGMLAAQYESPDLAAASDFLIDEKTHTALVAEGNRVLRFALPQPN